MNRKRILALVAIMLITVMAVGCGNKKTSDYSAKITEEDAKKIALEDAQLKEDEVTSLTVRSGIDDGVEEYEVNFYVDNLEYDYDIDAITGKIRSKDKDIEGNVLGDKNASGTEAGSANENTFSEADAKAAALEKVPGATDADIRINLDRDDGRQVYEGTILYEDREYDFEINAETGEIIDWSEESALND